ncbi:DUF4253 domain-containing protein [Desmospora profundinema]|uniref:DUF4253 domain-containing protein n=1 Tax=Desmospora profundinema TaxID=1571184 RepID=A0ABU1IPU3_9BACL|nr:DUF4253 domain-containing protein [Desmospora profundinema]MDR6226819.1 hypothetical protein [Desmospora profundinema]
MSDIHALRQLLQESVEVDVRPFFTVDFGRVPDESGLSLLLDKEEAEAGLTALRSVLPPGTLAFIGSTKWLDHTGDDREGMAELVLSPGEDQWDILRTARTNATNYEMDTDDVIRELKAIDNAVGIDIFHAETDMVSFRLKSDPNNWDAFCEDLYRLCPDIVDQGVGSVDDLQIFVRATREVQLWWD